MKMKIGNSFKKFGIERKERSHSIRKGMWDQRKLSFLK